jgi:molybdate transport system substrate-binding protein
MKTLYSILILGFFFSGCQTTPTLKIATSANMESTMKALIIEFNKSNPIEIDLIISSSGQLTSQIEHGAPYDVFVAANIKYPEYLNEKGLTMNQPQLYGYGQLALWSNTPNPTLKQLTSRNLKKIAIANPDTAPYGETTLTLLKTTHIYDSIKHKLVYGESISQVNQFIHSHSVDVGITSLSTVLPQKSLAHKYWRLIDSHLYDPIPQAAVILKNTMQQKKAQAFLDFLLFDKGKDILRDCGYLVD